VTSHDIPSERDLPAARFVEMKDDLMAQIEQDIDRQGTTGTPVVASTARPRWRRVALTAAAAAAAVLLTGVLALRDDDSASASPNFVEPTDDGFVRIHIEDLDDPERVEQDLADVGVPAVVDIHEGGGRRCDDARSDGWVTEPTPGLFPSVWADDAGDSMFDFRIDPDALRPGETLALEFFWDEHDGEWATMTSFRTSMSPIGECVLVEDDAIVVDAENAIVGG
jgi:hypothetical protein